MTNCSQNFTKAQMIESIPKKYAQRIDSLNNRSGRYSVKLKSGWYVGIPGHHNFTEDEIKDVISTMHLHTFVCECPICSFKGKSL